MLGSTILLTKDEQLLQSCDGLWSIFMTPSWRYRMGRICGEFCDANKRVCVCIYNENCQEFLLEKIDCNYINKMARETGSPNNKQK